MTDEPPPPVQRMRLFRMDEIGTLAESGFSWAHDSPGEWDGYFWLQAPYILHPSWGIDGLGRVLVADDYDYVIKLFGADGSPLLEVYNEVERRPIAPAVLDEYEATLLPITTWFHYFEYGFTVPPIMKRPSPKEPTG